MGSSLSSLKKKCWKLCSEYNRRKDCNFKGYTACVTCGRIKHWKELQGGHFIPSRCNSILFDDRGIHAQCYGCNCGQGGMWVEYEEYMLDRYGEEVVKELKRLKTQTKKFTIPELEALIEEYKLKIKNLKYGN